MKKFRISISGLFSKKNNLINILIEAGSSKSFNKVRLNLHSDSDRVSTRGKTKITLIPKVSYKSIKMYLIFLQVKTKDSQRIPKNERLKNYLYLTLEGKMILFLHVSH
jgi:hypothetical protein